MIAFELREAYAGNVEHPNPDGPGTVEVPYFTGGVISAGDRDIDVRAELDEGNGRILVADTDLAAIIALDAYSPLKRVTVTEQEAATNATERGYDTFTAEVLRADPRLADVTGVSRASKADLVTALAELDRRAGEPMPEEPPSIADLVAAGSRTPDNEEVTE